MIILVITWNSQGQNHGYLLPKVYSSMMAKVKERKGLSVGGVVLCLQEVSPHDNEFDLKLGREKLHGFGTNKPDSGNQRCNTAVVWSKGFTYESRETKFHSNRYWERVKLTIDKRSFWVESIHGPSRGPKSYGRSGVEISTEVSKDAREKRPYIVAGDMNCEPANVHVGKGGLVVSGHQSTHGSHELDFMITYGVGRAAHLLTYYTGQVSDHRAVGFLVEL